MVTTSLDVFLDTVWDKECPVHFKNFLVAYRDWCIKESQIMEHSKGIASFTK